MEKDLEKATREEINRQKSISKYLKLDCFCILGRDKETNMLLYKLKLPTASYQKLFINLCDLITSYDFNSLEFTSLDSIGVRIGETNRGRLRKVLNYFEDLGLIKDITENGYRRIYVNPKYYTKSLKLKLYTLNMFDCAYTEKFYTGSKNKGKVNIEKEDPNNIDHEHGF